MMVHRTLHTFVATSQMPNHDDTMVRVATSTHLIAAPFKAIIQLGFTQLSHNMDHQVSCTKQHILDVSMISTLQKTQLHEIIQ